MYNWKFINVTKEQLGTEKGENNFVLIYYNDLEYTRNVLQIKKDKLILQEKYLKEKRKIKAKISKKGSD